MNDGLTRDDARTLLISSSIGSIVEWYDFFVFASASALVFDRVFFPRADPRNGVLFALMTYAVGAAARRGKSARHAPRILDGVAHDRRTRR